ncbi:hypothetical protein SASPL_110849 [Salvia splendens]|uniref:Zinc finger CHCC-type domain-containing protein n=1 Tax=Salvia splendens TaxID=180675 RepID=A0A8X8Y670_SALSN|nr:hypothetical protein SASPL_110849 [Salvia splendens]
MAAFWRNNALTMATNLMKTLTGSSRNLSGIVSSEVSTSNTQKWMQYMIAFIGAGGFVDVDLNIFSVTAADVSDCLLLELTILDEERALCMTPEVLQSGLEEIVTTVRYRVSALALLSVDILAYRQDIHGRLLSVSEIGTLPLDTSKKSPMELINEVPPIKVEDRIAVCVANICFCRDAEFVIYLNSNPALGHPIEFICLEKDEPAVCKYCGLRYVQDHHH